MASDENTVRMNTGITDTGTEGESSLSSKVTSINSATSIKQTRSPMESSKSIDNVKPIEREYTAKEVQGILRTLTGNEEKIGLALLNYYARTDLVGATGRTKQRGRVKYSYADVVLLSWLFRMKEEGLPVNRFRRGIAYLRKRLPKLYQSPKDMILLTDGRQLFLKHRVTEKSDIAEVLTGGRTGQYVWAYSIGTLIEEVDKAIVEQLKKAA
jgi:hypothetical protein